MASSFKPNKRGLDQMQKDLQRELNKRPVSVKIHAETPEGLAPAPTTVNHYNGPITTINGSGNAQIAFNTTGDVNQSQEQNSYPVAEGYEDLAKAVTELRAALDSLGLEAEDAASAVAEADEVIKAVTQPEPDKSIVRKGITMLKGLISPVAGGLVAGASAEAKIQAAAFIARLSTGLPF